MPPRDEAQGGDAVALPHDDAAATARGTTPDGASPDDEANRAQERIVAWALDAGGMVCFSRPEDYLPHLGTTRYHFFFLGRSGRDGRSVTGVRGPRKGVDGWLAAMPAGDAVHTLDLRFSDVTGQGLALLGGRRVKALVLQRCDCLRLEDLQVLRTLPELEVLSLSGLPFEDPAIPCLGALPGLRRLELHGTGVTDGGVPGLLGLTVLERLGLGETRVTAASLPALARLPALRLLKIPGLPALDREALDRHAGR